MNTNLKSYSFIFYSSRFAIRIVAIFLFLNLILPSYSLANEIKLNIIPQPRSVVWTDVVFVAKKETISFQNNSKYRDAIAYFNVMNNRINGFEVPFAAEKNTTDAIISFNNLPEGSDNSYEIQVLKQEIKLFVSEKSIVNALVSLIQVFNQFAFQDEIRIKGLHIKDSPQYAWRGMHLDVCRHFFKTDFIKKYIDLLAFYKMNVFHWHLTEDQGWRIEIKKYPNLTTIGAWRNGSMIGHYNEQKFDTIRYGGFYTQEEIKDIVDYAKARNVTVVPEIELPGHALAALASYPELSCTGGPFDVAKGWGVFDDVYCPKEETFVFLENVLSEVCDLFPGEYIHIGGDECPKLRWKNCSHCQELMKKEGLKDEHELQSYFVRRIEKFLNTKGKKIIGWDEILEGGLAPNAAVMSWRGTEGGIAAAKESHFVVMSPGSHCYFDHYQGEPKNEPLAIGGYTSLQKVYSYHPTPEGLTAEQSAFILGAQANVWTEYITSPQQVEYMVFPRMLALSEVVWTDPKLKSESDFLKRVMYSHLPILSKLKVNYSESMFGVSIQTKKLNDGIAVDFTALPIGKIKYQITSLRSMQRKMITQDEEFINPISINQSCLVRAYLELENGERKQISQQKIFLSKNTGKNIVFEHPPSEQYKGNGSFTLCDGIRAVLPRINSEWLGWSGTDFNATIDLGSEDTITTIDIGFLHDPVNWIYAPSEIAISVSTDGKKYKQIKLISATEIKKMPRDVFVTFASQPARYVKIKAKNSGKIPTGKPGAGNNSWLFFDEVLID